MNRMFRQALVAVRIAATGLTRRWWSSLNAILGTAMVVGLLVALLSIGAGYRDAVRLASSDGVYMVMRAGARSEMESSLTGEQARLIAQAPQIARTADDRPLSAVEAYAMATIPDRSNGQPMNVAVRGVEPASFDLRPKVRLAEGRLFEPGRRELIAGRLASQRFAGLELGATVRLAGFDWTVVGIFEAEGSLSESEVWTDGPMVLELFGRGGNYQLALVIPQEGMGASALAQALNRDPRLGVRVVSQADYHAEQADRMQGFIRTLTYGIVFLMGLGAVFASLNTGHSHLKARAKDLATMSALGCSERALMLAVGLESLALSLIGASLGALAAHLIFDGRVISTLFYSQNFSQVVFAFSADAAVLMQAALVAIVIGLCGTIGPAMGVRRLPVSRILADRR